MERDKIGTVKSNDKSMVAIAQMLAHAGWNCTDIDFYRRGGVNMIYEHDDLDIILSFWDDGDGHGSLYGLGEGAERTLIAVW